MLRPSDTQDTGWRTPGQFMSATLTDLTPGARYFYRFGFMGRWSDEASFLARPKPGAPVAFFAFGDLGEDSLDDTYYQRNTPNKEHNAFMPPSRNTTGGMLEDLREGWRGLNFSLVVHDGDVSYARGYAATWDLFHDQIEPIATSMPWQIGIGPSTFRRTLFQIERTALHSYGLHPHSCSAVS